MRHSLFNRTNLAIAIIFCILVQACLQEILTDDNTVECGDGKCSALFVKIFHNGESEVGSDAVLTDSDCTLPNICPVLCPLLNYDDDCSLFTGQGKPVRVCTDLKSGDHIFLVPFGRLFMWPTYNIGHRVTVENISGRDITVETINQRPKVFRLNNFFEDWEADALITNALSIADETFRLKRSSTGPTGYNPNSMRTSEGAFDTHSPLALSLKRRGFSVLGIDPYDESFADGIQVIRYNMSAAYTSHLDWIEPTSDVNHDWDSSKEGTNRYATILLYLNDVTEGGETVFPLVKSQGRNSFVTRSDAEKGADSFLDSMNLTAAFPPGSWERDMVSICRSRFSVRPRRAEAILFYSQLPDGSVDRLSLHGGCPVTGAAVKWAANLWIWNGPRNGYQMKSKLSQKVKSVDSKIGVTFDTDCVESAHIFWENEPWSEMVPGIPITVNTYNGHRWNVKIKGRVVKTWVINIEDGFQQHLFFPCESSQFQI